MNIFASDPCPYKSAAFLDDKRVNKMTLETTQLLCTAINLYGGISPYKTTHVNHPSSIWVRASRANYLWTLKHLDALLKEYTARYGKIHKCREYYGILQDGAVLLPEGELTEFPNCTTFKHVSDVHLAYRFYLKEKWINDKRVPTWYKNTSRGDL